MVSDDDAVFKALADPTRRMLLDRLFERDGRTLSELEAQLPMTRFGVMKHLRVLEEAGLIATRKVGREKLHYLNPVPIQLIADRWINKYEAARASALANLKAVLEGELEGENAMTTESKPKLVNQIIIKAPQARVWEAITTPEFTSRYYYGSTVESTWTPGSTYRYAISGNDAIVGTVLEADAPRRLVQTFDARWDDDVAADAPSRLTWELEETAPGITKVTTIHDEFPSRTATYHQVSGGMPFILSGLKSLIETGEPLARREGAATA